MVNMSAVISRYMVIAHVNDITKSLTTDPSRFSRMVGGRGQSIGTFEGRIAGIKRLCSAEWFVGAEPQFCSEMLEFVKYVETGQPIWSEIAKGDNAPDRTQEQQA
jgi:hypothetical protein